MKHTKLRLILAASAAALIAGCASGAGGSVAGSSGCRTIWVFKPGIGGSTGGVQPVSNCGTSAGLPRERMAGNLVAPQSVAATQSTALSVVRVSPAAEATRPAYTLAKPYAGPNEMLENADMGAFMQRVREDYAAEKNAGAWGYVIVDALAAGDNLMAQDVVEAMAAKPDPDILSANHLRPWVYAANGRKDRATATIGELRRVMPPFMLRGHKALLAEGMGDLDGALAAYAEGPKTFNPPDRAQAGSPDYLARALNYSADRMLALRQAELYRTAGKDIEAKAVYEALAAGDPDDLYVQGRLAALATGKDKKPARTLNQALALAIDDEADLVEQRQSILGMMVGRGQRPPFNPLLSSLHQVSLLLDPDNGDIRVAEVGQLYANGKFEAALRMAQMGNPPVERRADLYSAAAQAALELGSPEAMSRLVEEGLKYDSSPGAKIGAASTLSSAGLTDRAVKLVDDVMKSKTLGPRERVAALLTRAQTHFQAGDLNGAIVDARAAVALQDDDSTQGFLASMLVKSPQRPEGLDIQRKMLMSAPGDTGQMNNFGYALIDGHASDTELDEGFRMLKEAARITPDEPNLLDSLGWAYYQYGDFREAKRYIGLALKAYEPFAHWELREHMGDVEWRLGDQEAARKQWGEAVKARPPAHKKRDIEGKLSMGLSTAAPVKRDTPEVRLSRPGRGQKDDI